MEFEVGDEVVYEYSKGVYKIISKRRDTYGLTKYSIQIGDGIAIETFHSELTIALPEGNKLVRLSNGCTCGSWITSWPDDHMHFCDKYKGPKA